MIEALRREAQQIGGGDRQSSSVRDDADSDVNAPLTTSFSVDVTVCRAAASPFPAGGATSM
jgi:hypothetical protein